MATKGLRVLLIVAGALALLGLALLIVGWLLGAPDRVEPHEGSTTVDGSFRSIRVQELNAVLRILPAEDGVCRVTYTVRSEDTPLDVRVENGTLLVTRSDDRPWYRKLDLFSWINGGVGSFGVTTLWLPEAQYESLTLKTATGDVCLEMPLTVGQALLETATGDVSVRGLSAETAELRTATGDLTLTDVAVQRLDAAATTGDAVLKNVVAGQTLSLRCVSGDLTLTDCDAGSALTLQTTTGSIRGSLLSPKTFTTHCVTGKVSVPASVEGAPECSISCVTGSITVTVVPKQ